MTVEIFIRINDIGVEPDPPITVDFKVNEVSVATYPKSIVPTVYSDTSGTLNGRHFKALLDLQTGASNYSGFILIRDNGKQVKFCDYVAVSAPFQITCTYDIGGQGGPPTYIEKLDSMDQYTKSQYIPNGLQRFI